MKYNSWQILSTYMFRHPGAIFKEAFETKEYKPNTIILVCLACIRLF